MTQVPGTVVKQLVGRAVHAVMADGSVVVGHLVSFDGRSLWMVSGGQDTFIPLGTLSGILPDPVPAPVLT